MDCSLPASSVHEIFPGKNTGLEKKKKKKKNTGLPYPSPGDPPDPGVEPASPALAGVFFTSCATREVLTPLLRGRFKVGCRLVLEEPGSCLVWFSKLSPGFGGENVSLRPRQKPVRIPAWRSWAKHLNLGALWR